MAVKSKRILLSLVCGAAALASVATAAYDLSWNTLDGGGAMWTTGGAYELSGTIGQSDAGTVLTGGQYTLTGGFWTPAAPAIVVGDMNCDGVLNAFDIDPFVLALTDAAAYAAAYPGCNRMNGDINGDGVVNAFDIDPFVELLTGP